MKKILLCVCCFLTATLLQAQTLFGTTGTGSANGLNGTINKFSPALHSLTIPYFFEAIASHPYRSNLIQASNGKLYGVTSEGGYNLNNGIIFSFDPVTSAYTTLKELDGINGRGPTGSLLQAGDGKLYGMTAEGGSNNLGVIFSFDISTSTYTKLKDFAGTEGANPSGSLIQASDGKLYGMTFNGGSSFSQGTASGYGVIFSFDLSSSTYTKLKDFDNINGSTPNGDLVQANDGKLYGLISSGGTNDLGIIFSFDPLTSAFANVKNLDGTNGGAPLGSLLKASDGKLYGMTIFGGASLKGVIFSFDPTTAIYTKLNDFDGMNGSTPTGNLIQASDGKLYGMTKWGGTLGVNDIGLPGAGVLFSFDLSTTTFTKLKDFDNLDGSSPQGSLMQASDGKIYGMTTFGGSEYSVGLDRGPGVIFSYDLSASLFTKLKDFGYSNGRVPTGSLLLASDGKLYGMTTFGGSTDGGVIFSVDTSTFIYSKLKDFDNTNGRRPLGGLVQAGDGMLYGMTENGGSNNFGVIFSFDPSTHTYTKLKDFDLSDGISPSGNLIEASNGKLYGMTPTGGSNGSGVIFSFDPSTLTYIKLKNFGSADGIGPMGSLVQVNDGRLYGMTELGGVSGEGVIFSIDTLGVTYTKLNDLDNLRGSSPRGTLIQAGDGKLYGLTYEGGNNATGVIFSFDPATFTYTKLKDFMGADGANPGGNLMQASDGKLYGVTRYGGTNNLGVIFSYNPTTSTPTYTKLQDYNGANGANPYLGAGFVEGAECTTSIAYYKDADGDGYGDPYSWKIALRQPPRYVANNGDCNDKNKAVHSPITYYRDADGDELGDANSSINICDSVSPMGYVKNKNDNNDNRKLQYALSNYPNPFEGTSTIAYELPFDSKVSIKVYDLFGRIVAVLVDEDKKTGIYTVNFKAARSINGSYYYKIIARSKDKQFIQTNKMIQLR